MREETVQQSFADPEENVAQLGLEPGMTVADFGAGSGAYVLAIARAVGTDGMVYANDVQKDLLRRIHNEAASQRLQNVRVICADLEKPHASKIGDQVLDFVLVSNVLFQTEDKKSVLAEARRVLKKGGTLAVIDWHDSFGGMGPHPDSVVAKDAGAALVSDAGFDSVREFSPGTHHWGLLACCTECAE